MNATDNASNPIKGRPTSFPLLIAFGVLGVAAYYAGPTVMAYAFLFQEEAKSRSIYESTRKSNAQELAKISDSTEMPTPGRNANSPSAPSADAVPTDLKPETAATPVTDEPAKEAPKE